MRNPQINKKTGIKTKLSLYFLMFVFLFSYLTQSLSSQGVTVTGAPDSLVPTTESEATATAKAQEIALGYLTCFLNKSSDAKNPTSVVPSDLVECIRRINDNLKLSFSQDSPETIISENSVFCNSLPVFAPVSLVTTPQAEKEKEENNNPPVYSVKEQRRRSTEEDSVEDITQQINSLVSNPVYETGYQKLHLCMAIEIDSVGFVILAKSKTPEERETDRRSGSKLLGNGDDGTGPFGDEGPGSGDDKKDPVLTKFGFGLYNEEGNNYDVIVQRGKTECINYFSISDTVSEDVKEFCKENIINATGGSILSPLSTSTVDLNTQNTTEDVVDSSTQLFDGFNFASEEGISTDEVKKSLLASIGAGIAFCGGLQAVEYLYDLVGFTSVASKDAQNKIRPCIINPLTEAVREQIINKIFKEYINYANSGFDGDTLRFDNLRDFTAAALDDTAAAYFSNVTNAVFGGCGISFPGLYLYLTAPSVSVADISCSPFKLLQNTYRERDRTIDEWNDQLLNPGKYSLGIQIDYLEQAKQAAVKVTTDFIGKSEDSKRLPKAKDKECVKNLIRKRNQQIVNQSTVVDGNRESLDGDRKEKLEKDFRKAGKGSVVSTAEALAECGKAASPDELKKLEETVEEASFTELISKDELRDLLGKAVGATLVGALRKYIREKEGIEPDDSKSPENPYTYVSQDPSQRILDTYNSSLKALWQQNLGAREFSTLIQLIELQEDVARLFQSYFVTLDTRTCILPGLYADGLADPADRKIDDYVQKEDPYQIQCTTNGSYTGGAFCFNKTPGIYYRTRIIDDLTKPIFGDEPSAKVLSQASSYIFRKDIGDQYFDKLTRWCFKNQTVSTDISNNVPFGGKLGNKIKFENKDFALRAFQSNVNGDFDISTVGTIGQSAHSTRESHLEIFNVFNSFLLLNSNDTLTDSEKDSQSMSLVKRISKANADLVLVLKESSISIISQVLEDTFDILKHQRTAAQQFGASIEFREWLKNEDGVNKSRLFVKEDSLYGASRNERFFEADNLFREGSGEVDSTFGVDKNIDSFSDYSDDREFCSFYKDSAIDINEISIITGQTLGTKKYIPTDCAVGHLSNLIKKGGAENDIENFNTYMINAISRLFAVYADAIVNSYTFKSQNSDVHKNGKFPSNGISNSYGRYYTEGAYHRDHSYILKQFVDDAALLGIYIDLNPVNDKYKNVYTKEKLSNIQKALDNKIESIITTSVLNSI